MSRVDRHSNRENTGFEHFCMVSTGAKNTDSFLTSCLRSHGPHFTGTAQATYPFACAAGLVGVCARAPETRLHLSVRDVPEPQVDCADVPFICQSWAHCKAGRVTGQREGGRFLVKARSVLTPGARSTGAERGRGGP